MSDSLSLTRREVLTQLGTLTGIGVLLSVVSGCGGSNTDSESRGNGRVQLTISWPDTKTTSRYIPNYAKSLVLELYHQDTPALRYTLVANRPDTLPATQNIAFAQLLPVGTYGLAGVARVDKDGQGATVASALTQVEVRSGLTANADLTLNSTIRTIEILGQPLSLQVGRSRTLIWRALDPDGKVLFLQGNTLTWSQVFGAEFGDITPDGRFTAKAIGKARVRLTESGANVSREADIQIVVKDSGDGLANSAWPKFRGNAQNTGRGGGYGAIGQKKWEFLTGGRVRSSPAVGSDGTVYVGSDDNKLYAIDAATGLKKWEFLTGGWVRSSPAVGSNGTVYVGSDDNKLYAIDAATGLKKWEFLTGGWVRSSPAVGSDGTVYVGSDINKLYAIDAATGLKKWEFLTEGNNDDFSPAIGADGTIYIGSGHNKLHAIDGAIGQTKWEFSMGGNIESYPAVSSDGIVYIRAGEFLDHKLHAIDGATGLKKWDFIIGNIGYIDSSSSPAIGTDGTVYIINDDGNLYAIDGATGLKKWDFLTGRAIYSSPALGSDGTLYFGSVDKNLYSIDAATGLKKWFFLTGGQLRSSPAIGTDGIVYVGSDDGKLYAIQ